mmetsp:Transcript_5767/g.16183  ORF Transcript_5767/g.16183 Transcript_5767/m.16183 type:complete len:171 (+) Transcript_5767:87-599(+)
MPRSRGGAVRSPRLLAVSIALRAVGVDAGIFSAYTKTLDERECTCNCCIKERRRPTELPATSPYKCAAAPGNDPKMDLYGCSNTCSVVNDPIFPSATTLEMNRFCFYHCTPTVGGSDSAVAAALSNQQGSSMSSGGSLVDSPCVSLSGEALRKAISSDHNGQDPMAIDIV